MANEPCPSIPGQYAGPVIGVVFIVGTFCLLAIVLLGYTEIEWKDIALVIVGALLNQCSVILSKWFTSSSSSDRKTEIMADTAKAAVINTAETAKALAAVEAAEKK